ncbi:hypothetical protein BDN70DRAFT_892846 [Pholiota conissans]|uniref:DUF6534 domain-containing protein n=1 Tax=Pholiota conissans TaxID=109636 RepID=A0A9P6CVR5_9AGAR|nr:hypothetical protein BDN70DRAFT_892846 [Pholiota conissans]
MERRQEENTLNSIQTKGPVLFLLSINWALFGALTIHVYLYYRAFSNDRRILKAMVCLVYLLETTQIALITGTAWEELVLTAGSVQDSVGTIWVSVYLVGGAVAIIAQIFYAYRILMISQNKIIPGVIVIMSLISFIAAVVLGVLIKSVDNFTGDAVHTMKISALMGIWTGASAASDVIIAGCMCYFLSQRIRAGCFPKTQAFITRVICMTIETGTITATVDLLCLALYFPPTLKNFYGVPISILAMLYSNTMMTLLNSRMKPVIISESETWKHNELSMINVSTPLREADAKLRFASTTGTAESGLRIPEEGTVA